MTELDRDPDLALEDDGILDVPTIDGDRLAPVGPPAAMMP
jgi:hypothetical protein